MDLPCSKVFDGWWEAFDVETFLREHLSAERIAAICRPKDKALTLVELVEQARKNSGQSSD